LLQIDAFKRSDLYRQALRVVNAECAQRGKRGTFPALVTGVNVSGAFRQSPRADLS
jgi:hypothetical protein